MRVSHEARRGCGYRKPGGLYLASDDVGRGCPLLPVPMEVCGCCGQGIKPARGWTWVQPDGLLPHHDTDSTEHKGCPLNKPGLMGDRAGLLWIGEVYYPTPADWISEGKDMGFSRRIAAVPKDYVPGETWVLCGHRKAYTEGLVCVAPEEYAGTVARNFEEAEAIALPWPVDQAVWSDRWVPAVFHLWRPDRVEYVVHGTESDDDLAALEARGIEPVQVVPVPDTLEVDGV